LAVVVVLVAGWAGAAAAAGDAALERSIVDQAGPGWDDLSGNTLSGLVEGEQRTLSGMLGDDVQVAAKGWANGDARVIVLVVDAHRPLPDPERQARSGVIGACATSTGNSPSLMEPFENIPSAFKAECSGTDALGKQVSVTAVMWVRGTQLVMVLATGGGAGDVIGSVADAQHEHMQRVGSTLEGTGGGTSPAIVVLAVLFGLAVLVGVVVAIVRRARGAPAPAPVPVPVGGTGAWEPPRTPPGWFVVGDDPSRQAYWDGERWLRQVRWTGAEWVDVDGASHA